MTKSILQLKQEFKKIYGDNQTPILKKEDKSTRIATYNVHYWADLYEKNNVIGILNDIKAVDADVMCLQEVSFGQTRYNHLTYQELIDQFKTMGYNYVYEIRSSYYLGADYGNMILSKYPAKKKQTALLYKGHVRVKRGYCLISLDDPIDLEICCVHLDVFDESGEIRKRQLDELIQQIKAPKKNLIICGDFNSIRQQDYTPSKFLEICQIDSERNATTDLQTLKAIEKINYQSCFDITTSASQSKPDCTVWSGRVIDFIFIPKNFIHKIQQSQIYYTLNSDHFAIYMDLLTN